MAKKLLEIFKSNGIIPSTLTPEQNSALEADINAYEADIRKAAQPAPAPGTPAAPQVVLPPELTETLSTLATTVTTLATEVKTIKDDVATRQQSQLEAEKAAKVTKYTEHVAKLLGEGRVTKAEHDALLTPEKQTANLAALDVFVDSSSKWAVQPGFKGAPASKATDEPGKGTPGMIGMNDADRAKADLNDNALAEIRASFNQ